MNFILSMGFMFGIAGGPYEILNLEEAQQFTKPVHIVASADDLNRFEIPTANDAVTYDELVFEAINSCKYAKRSKVDEKLLWRLVKIERQYNLPESLRGMTLAAACHESGYSPTKKGDRKFSKDRKPRALGLFQMWKWWEKSYGIDRTDVEASTHAYLKHVKRQLKTVQKKCKKSVVKNEKKLWLAAWATAIRSPKKKGRCYEAPLFYRRVLKKWHSNIKQYRQEIEECSRRGADGCGC